MSLPSRQSGQTPSLVSDPMHPVGAFQQYTECGRPFLREGWRASAEIVSILLRYAVVLGPVFLLRFRMNGDRYRCRPMNHNQLQFTTIVA